MMFQRKKLVLSMIFILLVFNVWQWWPHPEQNVSQNMRLTHELISADDFILAGHEIDDRGIRKVGRDLFIMHKSEKISKTSGISASEKMKQAAKHKSRKINKSRNTSGLDKFRLVVVLFKNGEKNAYLINGDNDYSVKKGDEIEGRYLVQEVTVSTVTLIEKSTKKSSIVTMQ